MTFLREGDMIQISEISKLDKRDKEKIIKRSSQDIWSIYEYVKEIVIRVKEKGDRVYYEQLKREGISLGPLEVQEEEIDRAFKELDRDILRALEVASKNIERFHMEQLEKNMWQVEISDGIIAGMMRRPIEKVGCYIPGGRASYPSTALMTVIPAQIAGVKEIVAVTPPREDMKVPPSVLVALRLSGCHRIFKIGGPWAIASLAYGTESIPKVFKIVGPGNRYVTAAKMVVFGDVDIDSPAGPSEVLILADGEADPKLIAMDLLSQAEHDPDSASILVTTSEEVAVETAKMIDHIFKEMENQELLNESLKKYTHILIAKDMDEAVEFVNEYAPEHLEIHTKEPFMTLSMIDNAGSIFLGPWSCVPVGDYASGTNHVLPTAQCARAFSGLSIYDFQKCITYQYLSKKGLENLKDTVITLSKIEGLPLHGEAVRCRVNNKG